MYMPHHVTMTHDIYLCSLRLLFHLHVTFMFFLTVNNCYIELPIHVLIDTHTYKIITVNKGIVDGMCVR